MHFEPLPPHSFYFHSFNAIFLLLLICIDLSCGSKLCHRLPDITAERYQTKQRGNLNGNTFQLQHFSNLQWILSWGWNDSCWMEWSPTCVQGQQRCDPSGWHSASCWPPAVWRAAKVGSDPAPASRPCAAGQGWSDSCRHRGLYGHGTPPCLNPGTARKVVRMNTFVTTTYNNLHNTVKLKVILFRLKKKKPKHHLQHVT